MNQVNYTFMEKKTIVDFYYIGPILLAKIGKSKAFGECKVLSLHDFCFNKGIVDAGFLEVGCRIYLSVNLLHES